MQHTFRLALAGNPNCGKSSIFNYLTGLNQRVGNYPGVTVDKKSGSYKTTSGQIIEIIDLPGTYSLHPNSLDEYVVTNILSNPDNNSYPDAVLYVADYTQLDKQFLLLNQIQDLGIPCAMVLTMGDLKEDEGVEVNIKKLQKEYNIPIAEVSIRKKLNQETIHAFIDQLTNDAKPLQQAHYNIPSSLNKPLLQVQAITGIDNNYANLIHLIHSDELKHLSDQQKAEFESIRAKEGIKPLRLQIEETMARYNEFPNVITRTKNEASKYSTLTDKIDQVLTNKFAGPIIFIGLMLLVFQAIFSWSSYPMDAIDWVFGTLSEFTRSILPEGMLTDLLVDGIIAGLGGVFIFIPQITILFLLLTLFEEIGYMSRVVYLFDKILSKFGLNGRSLIAFISSGACAIPAVMSTRTISNNKERLITMMVAPLISCSARLPVYVVLIGFIVPSTVTWGIFNAQGVAFMSIYILTTLVTLIVAWIFKKILKSKEESFLMITLPAYRAPHFKNVLLTVYERVATFIKEAGKIIFVLSIVIWVACYFGPTDRDTITTQAEQELTTLDYSEQEQADYIDSKILEHSFAGHVGQFIEPTIKPLGYDWKIGIALLTSFAAREVFVGTMATIYSMGSNDDESSIAEKMSKQTWKDGRPIYSLATAASLMLFYMFAMQCMSTVAVVKRETKSWKWPLIQFGYMTALAYFSALIAYQLLS